MSMSRWTALIGVACLACAVGSSFGDEPAPVVFPQGGFSITPLDAPAKVPARQIFLIMMLPATDGFAPNVNVLRDPYTGTLEDHIKVTKETLTKQNFTLLETRQLGKDGAAYEYTGSLQNRPMHWYAKSILSRGHVYVATGSATEGQWPTFGDQLKKCVDSLEMTNPK